MNACLRNLSSAISVCPHHVINYFASVLSRDLRFRFSSITWFWFWFFATHNVAWALFLASFPGFLGFQLTSSCVLTNIYITCRFRFWFNLITCLRFLFDNITWFEVSFWHDHVIRSFILTWSRGLKFQFDLITWYPVSDLTSLHLAN